jgi:hypothetical protein
LPPPSPRIPARAASRRLQRSKHADKRKGLASAGPYTMNPRLLLALFLSAGVLWLAPTQVPLTVRMRIPIYDYATGKWHYYKPNLSQFQVDPDPDTVSKSDGIFSLKPQPQLEAGASLPNGTVGSPYSQSLFASGGTAPYSWAVTSGALPPGLTLSSSGIISGTPTAAGTFTVGATVTDSAGLKLTMTFTSSPAIAVGASIPGRTLVPGGSIFFESAPGTDALVLDIDRRNVKHRIVMVPPPQPGTVCEDLGAEILSDAQYLCDDTDSTNNYGTWVRAAIQKTW